VQGGRHDQRRQRQHASDAEHDPREPAASHDARRAQPEVRKPEQEDQGHVKRLRDQQQVLAGRGGYDASGERHAAMALEQERRSRLAPDHPARQAVHQRVCGHAYAQQGKEAHVSTQHEERPLPTEGLARETKELGKRDHQRQQPETDQQLVNLPDVDVAEREIEDQDRRAETHASSYPEPTRGGTRRGGRCRGGGARVGQLEPSGSSKRGQWSAHQYHEVSQTPPGSGLDDRGARAGHGPRSTRMTRNVTGIQAWWNRA
jgi:hypothetical protein